MKTLEQARKYWEAGGDIVGHWEFEHQAFRITLLRKGGGSYTLVRYFTIGGSWQTSCDMEGVSAEAAFARLAYLTGGKREGGEE